MMKAIILVGLGGGLGSIFRYLTSVLTNTYFHSLFPYATFVVNIIGCFLTGVLMRKLFIRNASSFSIRKSYPRSPAHIAIIMRGH